MQFHTVPTNVQKPIDTLWLRAFKNAFKGGTGNFVNSLSPPTIMKQKQPRDLSDSG